MPLEVLFATPDELELYANLFDGLTFSIAGAEAQPDVLDEFLVSVFAVKPKES